MSLHSILGHLGPRSRKLLRYVGLVVLALVSFVFAFQLTFPFDRVKDKIIEALSEKYEVNIGDVERGIIPGRVYFKAFSIRTRPAKSGDVATTFYMDRLGIDVGLLALLRGAVSVKLDAKIGPGRINGKIGIANSGTSVHLTGEDLPSASLPMREVIGLPMSGKVRFAVDLELPNDKSKSGKVAPNWPKAEGSAEFACPSGCSVGDGKSKLKLTTNNGRQQEFLDASGGGIDFGKINIDSLLADVEIKNGKLDVTKLDTRSGDGEVHLAFTMNLNQDLMGSLVAGCLRFRGSDALLKREPKTHAAFSTTGAPVGPDNLFHIKLDGPLRAMRRIGVVCGPSTNTNMDNPGGAPPRPNLSANPEPAKPPGLGSVSMPPPAAPAMPPPTAVAPQNPVTPAVPNAPSPTAETPRPGMIGESPAPTTYPSNGSGVPGAQPIPPPGPPAGTVAPTAVPPQSPPQQQPPPNTPQAQ
jgi:type II secretion system protein N